MLASSLSNNPTQCSITIAIARPSASIGRNGANARILLCCRILLGWFVVECHKLDAWFEVATTVARFYLFSMLQRTLPAGFIARASQPKLISCPPGGERRSLVRSGRPGLHTRPTESNGDDPAGRGKSRPVAPPLPSGRGAPQRGGEGD